MRGLTRARWLAAMEHTATELEALRQRDCMAVLHRPASDGWGPYDALRAIDTIRWLERVGYHTWRVCNYLGTQDDAAPSPVQTPTS